MNRKKIIRECLYFLGALCVGFFILPVILILFLSPQPSVKDYGEFLDALFSGGLMTLFAWMCALTPYLLFQLIRFIVWALDVKSHSKNTH